jgi:tetratricopeptide (TPR) repeat protein
MTTKLKRRMAQEFYDKGFAGFQAGKYEQAIVELRKAEDAFRELDVVGQPFGFPLPNGVSGLANTLALEGRCFQALGDYQQAVTRFESCLVNGIFERKRPFQAFWSALRTGVIACYEKTLEQTGPETLKNPKRNPDVDISFLFPFSLSQESIPVARLYELAPERYPQFGDFYAAARKKDIMMRRMDKRSDESTMKKLSISVWGSLVAIWIAYGLLVAQVLL